MTELTDVDRRVQLVERGAVDLGLSPPMTRAPILAWSDAAITVQVPPTAPLGPTAVIVTVDGRSSNAATLEIKP